VGRQICDALQHLCLDHFDDLKPSLRQAAGYEEIKELIVSANNLTLKSKLLNKKSITPKVG
jgi:hypothetical protein